MTLEDLKAKGFDVDAAMELCIDDEDIFREVLDTALEEGREKIPFIRECYEQKAYERYIIEVHGLKNAAKQIGAMELSDMAKKQEFAGKEQKYDIIDSGIEPLLQKYQEDMDTIAAFLG